MYKKLTWSSSWITIASVVATRSRLTLIPLALHSPATRLVFTPLGGSLDLMTRQGFSHFDRTPAYLNFHIFCIS